MITWDNLDAFLDGLAIGLVMWALVAVLLGIVIGKAAKMAEEREGHSAPDDARELCPPLGG